MNKQKKLIEILTGKGVVFESGLTDDEVLAVQLKFGIVFPPDLKLFLQTALPVSTRFINWRKGLHAQDDYENIRWMLNLPLEGILFDIESNNFWFDSWGNKPESNTDRELIARKCYKDYPQLIPIYAHRFVPSEPNEVGNPIFSVHQTDIIYYGNNLVTYLSNEFYFRLPDDFNAVYDSYRYIPFWSDMAD